MPKPYARIAFTESELLLLRGSLSAMQGRLREKAVEATDPTEKDWYWSQVKRVDPLIEKLGLPGLSDHSQDADEDSEEEEGEPYE